MLAAAGQLGFLDQERVMLETEARTLSDAELEALPERTPLAG